ncbi:MAG: tryptophan--tRNA ligase, partial [Myxococcota bacterium]
YVYPALMAADLLAYKATHVPVGEDQRQHLEFARDVAKKFNHDFAGGEEEGLFPLPEPLILGTAARVMSLRDGTRKMSKSDPVDGARINLTDDADAIAAKVGRARTDTEVLPGPEVLDDSGQLFESARTARPACFNLLGIYASLETLSWHQVLAKFEGKGYGALKQALTERLVEELQPLRAEILRLTSDPAQLDAVLQHGANRAMAIAVPVVREAKRAIGLL